MAFLDSCIVICETPRIDSSRIVCRVYSAVGLVLGGVEVPFHLSKCPIPTVGSGSSAEENLRQNLGSRPPINKRRLETSPEFPTVWGTPRHVPCKREMKTRLHVRGARLDERIKTLIILLCEGYSSILTWYLPTYLGKVCRQT